MKRIIALLVFLFCLPPYSAGAQESDAYTDITLSDIGLASVYPSGWALVTPDTAARHAALFDGQADPAAEMRARNVYALAVSPSGDARLSFIAEPGDETARLYADIDRYTPAMRTAIKNDFLDKEAWALTGYRYAQAEWTNRSSEGRLLHLSYTVRYGEETVARGRQVYTIRNALSFTIDLKVTGRAVTSAEEALLAAVVKRTVFPVCEDMPLLPVGLTVTSHVPEETNQAALSVRGTTTKGALVSAYWQGETGDPLEAAQATAGASGSFRLDVTVPETGEWRLLLASSLEGFADCQAAYWVSYDTKRLPVSFTSLPSGDVYDAQIIVSGKTLPGVTVQCMEGDKNLKAVTGSNGVFSFKLDRGATGDRSAVLSLTKKNYPDRRVDISFNRKWHMEDYVQYISGQVQPLSYRNLSENAAKYVGRLVQYTGQVIDVSQAGNRQYVQLGMKPTKDGKFSEMLVAVAEGMDAPLSPGDSATLYVEVTEEVYGFPSLTEDGDEVELRLPSVKLIAYQKNG